MNRLDHAEQRKVGKTKRYREWRVKRLRITRTWYIYECERELVQQGGYTSCFSSEAGEDWPSFKKKMDAQSVIKKRGKPAKCKKCLGRGFSRGTSTIKPYRGRPRRLYNDKVCEECKGLGVI